MRHPPGEGVRVPGEERRNLALGVSWKIGIPLLLGLIVGPLLNQPGTAASSLGKLLEATAFNILGVSKSPAIKTAVLRRWLAADTGNSEAAASTHPVAAEALHGYR